MWLHACLPTPSVVPLRWEPSRSMRSAWPIRRKLSLSQSVSSFQSRSSSRRQAHRLRARHLQPDTPKLELALRPAPCLSTLEGGGGCCPLRRTTPASHLIPPPDPISFPRLTPELDARARPSARRSCTRSTVRASRSSLGKALCISSPSTGRRPCCASSSGLPCAAARAASPRRRRAPSSPSASPRTQSSSRRWHLARQIEPPRPTSPHLPLTTSP